MSVYIMDDIFFSLSKLIWALLRPGTVLFLLTLFALWAVLRRRLRLAISILSLLVFLILTVGIFPVGHFLARPLESQFPSSPEVADVRGIIILGGAENTLESAIWGRPQVNEAGERIVDAYLLARRHPEAVIVLAGGGAFVRGRVDFEAGVAAEILTDLGLGRERLILEGQSRNTVENARFARKLVADVGEGNWLLVSSAMHLPRAMATFCRAGWSNLVAWPTDYQTGTFHNGIGWDLLEHTRVLTLALREWIGILGYWGTGRLSLKDLGGCRPAEKH